MRAILHLIWWNIKWANKEDGWRKLNQLWRENISIFKDSVGWWEGWGRGIELWASVNPTSGHILTANHNTTQNRTGCLYTTLAFLWVFDDLLLFYYDVDTRRVLFRWPLLKERRLMWPLTLLQLDIISDQDTHDKASQLVLLEPQVPLFSL